MKNFMNKKSFFLDFTRKHCEVRSKLEAKRRDVDVKVKFERSTDVLQRHYPSILRDLCEYIDTPKALAVAMCIRYMDRVDTADLKAVLSVSHRNYTTVHAYKNDAQAVALLKKTEMFPLRYDQDDHISFYNASEALARNQRNMVVANAFSFETRTLIERARGIIHRILKTTPSDFLETRFGPGSTYSLKGKDSHVIAKLEHHPECTPLAHEYVYRAMHDRPLHVASYKGGDLSYPLEPMQIVPGDRFCLVKKDIFGPRCMAPQPTGNMLVQLDIAEVMERRFRRFSGISLDKQDQIHGNLMRYAWDLYGTIDLSNASDSISLHFLELLFPSDWFCLIRSVTCRQTKVDGKWYPNSKAFAQGCGLTFITETILFYALALAYCETQVAQRDQARVMVSVYGDDIIVPIHCHTGVVKLLTSCGFAVNASKSFGLLDNFKESCGVDTISGINVRPVYFKAFDASQSGFTILANSVTRLSEFIVGCRLYDVRLWRIMYRLATMFAEAGFDPVFVPRSYSETEGVWSDTGWRTRFKKGLTYIHVLSEYRERTLLDEERPWSSLAALLLGTESSGYETRGARSRARKRWTTHNRGASAIIVV